MFINSPPGVYPMMEVSTLPYLSNSPASTLTIFPSIILLNISRTSAPKGFTTPVLTSGVSIQSSRQSNFWKLYPIFINIFTVSPSQTDCTFPQQALPASVNQGASGRGTNASYSAWLRAERASCPCTLQMKTKTNTRLAGFNMYQKNNDFNLIIYGTLLYLNQKSIHHRIFLVLMATVGSI